MDTPPFVARKETKRERSSHLVSPERSRIIRRGTKCRLTRSGRNYECKRKETKRERSSHLVSPAFGFTRIWFHLHLVSP